MIGPHLSSYGRVVSLLVGDFLTASSPMVLSALRLGRLHLTTTGLRGVSAQRSTSSIAVAATENAGAEAASTSEPAGPPGIGWLWRSHKKPPGEQANYQLCKYLMQASLLLAVATINLVISFSCTIIAVPNYCVTHLFPFLSA